MPFCPIILGSWQGPTNDILSLIGGGNTQTLHHPAGASVNSVKCNKSVNSMSHYGQWGHFFLACGHTNSGENPWISQSSLDLSPKQLDI